MSLTKCSFCQSEANKRGFIHIKSQVYGLQEESVCLQKIAFEIINVHVDDGLVCEDCHKQLVDAYIFKTMASKSFESMTSHRSKILKTVNEFVMNDTKDLTLMQFNNSLAVVSEPDISFLKCYGWKDANDSAETFHHVEEEEDDEGDEDEDAFEDDSDLGTEFTDNNFVKTEAKLQDRAVNIATTSSVSEEEEPLLRDITDVNERVREMSVVSEITCPMEHDDDEDSTIKCKDENSNENLQGKSKNKGNPAQTWLEEQMAKCQNVMQSDDGPVSINNCIFCQKVFLSRAGIKSHLLKEHYEKSSDKQSEVKYEKNRKWIYKMVDKSKVANGEAWKCCICNKFTTQFMKGIRHHIVNKHCVKGPMQVEKIQKHFRSAEWIMEMVDNSAVKDDSNIWNCSVCKKVSSNSRNGIRTHITMIHTKPSKIRRLKQVKRLKDDDDDEGKHERDPEWVEEMIVKSESPGDTETWTCCLCDKYMGSLYYGIKCHIYQKHCRKIKKKDRNRPRRSVGASSEAQIKYTRDPEWVKDMVEKSQSIDDPNLWTCCICNDFTSKYDSGIRGHIFNLHCEKGRITKSKKQNDESIERHERDYEWILEMIEKSAEANKLNSWTCCICNDFSSKFHSGIRSHIDKMHCKKEPMKRVINGGTSMEDEIERHERDYEWILEMIEKSAEANKLNSWTCCICNKFSSKFLSGIRSHIDKMHCKKEPMKRLVMEETPNGDGIEKHERDSAWVKEMVEKSKPTDGSSNWICSLCSDYTSSSFLGLKYHIFRAHCVEKQQGEDVDELDYIERDPGWIKEMLEKSKPIDANTDWICCVCNTFQSSSELSLRNHMTQKHFQVRKSILMKDMLKDDENEVQEMHNDTIESQIKIEWIKSIIIKTVDEHENKLIRTCSLCKMNFDSYKEIKRHISRRHRQELDSETQVKIKEAYDMIEATEINERIDKCHKKLITLNGFSEIWVCYDCKGRIYYKRSDIHRHLCVDHMDMKNYDEEFPQESNSDVKKENEDVPEKMLNEKYALDAKYQPKVFLKLLSPECILSVVGESQNGDNGDELRGKNYKVADMTPKERMWLKLSIKRSKDAVSKSWNCWICRDPFKHNSTLRYHLMAHHLPYYQQDLQKYKAHVQECRSKNYERKILPKRKVLNKLKVTSNQKLKQCSSCDFEFKLTRLYRAHMKVHFLSDPVVKKMTLNPCEMCTMTFRNLEDLSIHRNVHLESGQIEKVPAKGFKFPHLFNPKFQSVKSHHEEKDDSTFHCGHCDKKYASELEIKRHIMFRHFETLTCPLDNEKYSRLNDFFQHINMSHADLARNVIQPQDASEKCGHCELKFEDKLQLLEHLSSALEEKNLFCQICGEVFLDGIDNIKHMEKHVKNEAL